MSAVAAALLMAGAWSPAMAQTTPVEGTVYSTHTPKMGDCPALDWHVAVGPKNTLTGMVATDGMKNIWRITGTFNAQHKFRLEGQEVGGAQRTGAVEGEIRPDGSLNAAMGGFSSASPCEKKSVYIPWFRNGNNAYDPAPRAGGG